MNWLGHETLQFVQTLSYTEQEKCRTSLGLFKVCNEKFRPQHSETLQYCKLIRAGIKMNRNGCAD